MLRRGGVRYTAGTMKARKLVKEMEGIAAAYCVTDGKKFRLKDFNPGDTDGVKSKKVAESLLEGSSAVLAEMQEKFYAKEWGARRLIFQGMDAWVRNGGLNQEWFGLIRKGCESIRLKPRTTKAL